MIDLDIGVIKADIFSALVERNSYEEHSQGD